MMKARQTFGLPAFVPVAALALAAGAHSLPAPAAQLGRQQDLTIINPTSKAKLWATLLYPTGGEAGKKHPVVVVIPGGLGFGSAAVRTPLSDELVQAGFIVGYFDPDGRGRSGGKEDYNGKVHQDGLHEFLKYLATLPRVEQNNVGLFSTSLGLVMAAGALARYPDDPPVKYFIDVEGPSDRFFVTKFDDPKFVGVFGHASKDESWWAEREAVSAIKRVRYPYLRIQKELDHVHGENKQHALDMVNAATHTKFGGQGQSPWTRINGPENEPNRTYSRPAAPKWLPARTGPQTLGWVREMAVLNISSSAMSNTGRWSEPVNISEVNSTFDDKGPAIAADGKMLYISSTRLGGEAIFQSAWEAGHWSSPRPLPPEINAGGAYDPSFTGDGKTMFFHSMRPGGHGGQDIWYSTLKDGSWTPPRNAGPNINTAAHEWTVSISADGTTMYFMARGREGNIQGSEDLWFARKVDGEWQKAERLPPPINTEHNEVCPWITADGKRLYFARMIFDGPRIAEHHIWVSEIVNGRPGPPVKLPAPVNLPGVRSCCPTLTADGKILCFAADRRSGVGRHDIWLSRLLE
ncbi:MAG: PD40 domain-containing protein [Acidobacteria bacterium]|nr:PD40 domain-containing protein [Acidobacteriota bacterium]